VDLGERRELNNGFGDALSRAVELVVTPAVMGFLGWLLDRWLGTWPVFALVLFFFTVGYMIWKLFLHYDEEMRAHEQKLFGPRPAAGAAPEDEAKS
jgi:uncharacterized membrane protein